MQCISSIMLSHKMVNLISGVCMQFIISETKIRLLFLTGWLISPCILLKLKVNLERTLSQCSFPRKKRRILSAAQNKGAKSFLGYHCCFYEWDLMINSWYIHTIIFIIKAWFFQEGKSINFHEPISFTK